MVALFVSILCDTYSTADTKWDTLPLWCLLISPTVYIAPLNKNSTNNTHPHPHPTSFSGVFYEKKFSLEVFFHNRQSNSRFLFPWEW